MMRDAGEVIEQFEGLYETAMVHFRQEIEDKGEDARILNPARADRAGRLMTAYLVDTCQGGDPDSETVQDLMTDLAHWLQRCQAGPEE